MIFSWLRKRRRQKVLASPFPRAWLPILHDNLLHYRYLNDKEQARLRDHVQVFIAEKNWEGCRGLELTDEMRVTIAGHACLMALYLPDDPFGKLLSVLVYSGSYTVPEERWHQGWSIVGPTAREGESWYRGPVILSWEDIRRDAHYAGDGHNLVWHEFAHQLDMLDRSTDGTPPLANRDQRRRWHDVMTAEFTQLADDARQGRPTVLDPYGATNEAEFFAVASECFFDCPADLRDEHPKMYALLAEYYRQDPATRMERVG